LQAGEDTFRPGRGGTQIQEQYGRNDHNEMA